MLPVFSKPAHCLRTAAYNTYFFCDSMHRLEPKHLLCRPNTEDIVALLRNSHRLAGNSNNLAFHITRPDVPISNDWRERCKPCHFSFSPFGDPSAESIVTVRLQRQLTLQLSSAVTPANRWLICQQNSSLPSLSYQTEDIYYPVPFQSDVTEMPA